ncbi:MAG: phosphonate degradation HD-domain oxygenase [Bacteroidota bacterium]
MDQSHSIEQRLDHLFSLYRQFGDADYIGEPVSQLEHMSQSAQLAINEGYDDEVVLAAFFHDIGHICVQADEQNQMGGFGAKRHEQIGADYLRSLGFPERVAQLVENHVQAKRYLTCRFPNYYQQLSEASKQTLAWQGGPMSEEEARVFEQDPLFETSLLLRKWDELAKETNLPVIDLELLKDKARRVLALEEAI